MRSPIRAAASIALLTLGCVGCQSPYHSDQDALAGGVLGAGAGALVGHAMGNTAAGAVVGAGVGALSGAAIGASADETEARNRAYADARYAQQRAAANAVSVPDVVTMTRNGLDEAVIINQIRSRGLAAPLQTADLIYMQQQRVTPRVVETMQSTGVAMVQPVAVYPPQPYVIQGSPGYYYYGDPHYYYRPEPSVGVGLSFRGR